jgi:glycosyltransferase involved in cell wall biosynthesis
LGQRAEVNQILSAADVYVQSSRWEGMPVALLEAMGSGLPIVATSVGETPFLNPRPELLVAPADGQALATALASATGMVRTDSQRLSRHQGVAARYGLEDCARRWVRLYLNVLMESGRGDRP